MFTVYEVAEGSKQDSYIFLGEYATRRESNRDRGGKVTIRYRFGQFLDRREF